MIRGSILDDYENLLRAGMWSIAKLQYDPENAPKDMRGNPVMTPVVMKGFDPFQASSISVRQFTKKRAEFSTEEWIDVLITTIGLNPEVYGTRVKLLLLQRLVPLVEPNVNLMGLCPRATGKTYRYRNTSYYTRIISGGRVSPAVLFYDRNPQFTLKNRFR